MTDFESGQIENLVIGIGINTSLDGFPDELLQTAGAVDLTGAAPDSIPKGANAKSLLAAEVIRYTLDYTSQISEDGPAFLDVYREKSLVLNHDIKVYKGTYRKDPTSELGGIPAKALAIDDNGGLEVIYTNGERETLTTGEVTIRL